LLEAGLFAEVHPLKNAEKKAEFVYIQNCDSSDFVNDEKFERFILKRVKVVEPFRWDMLQSLE
jgi:hypothetical protein